MSMISNEASVIDEGHVQRSDASSSHRRIPSKTCGPPSPSRSTSPGGSVRRAFDGSGVGARGTLTFPDYGAVPLRIEALDAPRSRVVPMGQRRRQWSSRLTRSMTSTLPSSPSLSGRCPEGTRLTVLETGFETTSDSDREPREPPHGFKR